MSRYRVELRPVALKALHKLDRPVRRRLQSAIDRLADDPRPNGALAFVGQKGYLRIRVGDYRIIYTVEDSVLLVLVVDVDHRSTVYRSR